LVLTVQLRIAGVVVSCRAVGILEMEDEQGQDAKVLAVPEDRILQFIHIGKNLKI
jgi:inorganic pyrophosphatase